MMKFGGIMSERGIFAASVLGTAKSVLLKDLQRWRADDIRPYTVCATEISPRSFGGTVCVGADIMSRET